MGAMRIADEKSQETAEEGIAVSSRLFLFLVLGFVLVVVGIAVILIATVLYGGGSASYFHWTFSDSDWCRSRCHLDSFIQHNLGGSKCRGVFGYEQKAEKVWKLAFLACLLFFLTVIRV